MQPGYGTKIVDGGTDDNNRVQTLIGRPDETEISNILQLRNTMRIPRRHRVQTQNRILLADRFEAVNCRTLARNSKTIHYQPATEASYVL